METFMFVNRHHMALSNVFVKQTKTQENGVDDNNNNDNKNKDGT